MTLPKTGPYSRSLTWKGPPTSLGYFPKWGTWSRTWYRQRRPYTLPLTYSFSNRRVLSYAGPPDSYTEYQYGEGPSYDVLTPAYNKAYHRFVAGIKGETSQLSVALAEHRQSLNMIQARSAQLLKAAIAVKQLRFVEAAKILGLQAKNFKSGRWDLSKIVPPSLLERYKRKRKIITVRFDSRKTAKAFANNWLEFSFGWLPLMGDIYTSVDVLQRQYPSALVRGRANVDEDWLRVTNPLWYNYSTSRNVTRAGVRIAATATIENPNLFRANQLGLVNPLTLLYEIVPFSFVLNWFVNVEEFLSSYTDFTGVKLSNPYITRFQRTVTTKVERNTNVFAQPYGKVTFYSSQYESVSVSRTLGYPSGPSLRVRPPWRLQPWRAANAVALLLQALKPGR